MSNSHGSPNPIFPSDNPRSITDALAFAGSGTSTRKLTADDWLRISDQQRERKANTRAGSPSKENTRKRRKTKDSEVPDPQTPRSQREETKRKGQNPRRRRTQPTARSIVEVDADQMNETVVGGPIPKVEKEVLLDRTLAYTVSLQGHTQQVSLSTSEAMNGEEHYLRRATAEEWMCAAYPDKRGRPSYRKKNPGLSTIQQRERDKETMMKDPVALAAKLEEARIAQKSRYHEAKRKRAQVGGSTRTTPEAGVYLDLEKGITMGLQVETELSGDMIDWQSDSDEHSI
ncbi:hypothetical protein PM082_011361 [Marasmius tenuissimus]|nr:hypothetical protein PM082_011361 [Marasmius tenuissimus]